MTEEEREKLRKEFELKGGIVKSKEYGIYTHEYVSYLEKRLIDLKKLRL